MEGEEEMEKEGDKEGERRRTETNIYRQWKQRHTYREKLLISVC